MNKAYRVVRNKATGTWTVVSEIARGYGKGRAAMRAVSSVLVAGAAAVLAPSAMAQLVEQDPSSGTINIGSGTDGTVVSIANEFGENRRLMGVANGRDITDAINYGQFSSVNNGIARALGGGAVVNSITGAVTAPTYSLYADPTDPTGTTTYRDVGSALGNLNNRIKANGDSITNLNQQIVNGTIGLVQQADATSDITVAKDTGGASVNFAGKDADGNAITRKLTNVTAGTADTDAVNYGQLRGVKSVADQAAEDVAKAGKDIANLDAHAVKYDSTGDSVTLNNGSGNPVQVKNVADGKDNNDAVNVQQLKNAGLIGDDGGIANAVIYGDATKSSVTLNKGGAAVRLGNVADGKVEADSKDAVNGGQLHNVKTVADKAAEDAAQAGKDIANLDARAVKYDSTGDSVTLNNGSGNPVQIKNVANGKDDHDAVNVQQLKNAGLIGGDGSIANAVIYDDATMSRVTLNKGGAAVQLGNVANGKVETDSKDAVNGGQLNDVKSVADTAANLASNSVQYDAGGTSVTLKGAGTGPVQIKNVAEGTDDTDAVNVRQLKKAGLVGDDGSVANVVVYDDASKSSVTLNNGGAAVKLANVANGVADNDAVNFSQLNGVGSALGGGAGFKDGVWTGPTYTFLNGDKSTNVGDALSKLDSRVFTLEGSTSIGSGANDKFAGSGANSGDTTKKEEAKASGNYATASGANAVASGQSSTATGANAQARAKNSVALGADSIADREDTVSVGSVGNERFITNVKAGTNDTDAVNYGQFKDVKAQADATQQAVGSLQSQVNQMDGKINRVGAMGAAMSTMMASAAGLQTDNRMAVGTGLYRGQTALAIGYQRKIGSRATVTIGGSTAGGSEYNVGVGAGYGW